MVIGFLAADKEAYFEENISKTGFLPQIYSPYYKLVINSSIEKSHRLSMKLVLWTVNSLEEIRELQHIRMGGIITDYPNLLNKQEKL